MHDNHAGANACGYRRTCSTTAHCQYLSTVPKYCTSVLSIILRWVSPRGARLIDGQFRARFYAMTYVIYCTYPPYVHTILIVGNFVFVRSTVVIPDLVGPMNALIRNDKSSAADLCPSAGTASGNSCINTNEG